MFGRAIRFAINKNVQRSTILPRFLSSASTQSNHKNRNLVDDIRESASGLPPTPRSSSVDDRVNVVKTSTTSPSSIPDRREDDGGDTGSFVADAAKQGVVKAMETGLNIGEMAKKTLDNVWDVTKDTTHKVKEAVTGDEDRNNDVPPTDHFVDDLRKHADGYDRRRNI